jgi:hypothetical protein
MAKKSNAKRIDRLEDICIGAGFLLMKLNMQFSNEMGEGMRLQVHQCIQDCNAVARAQKQRAAAAEGRAAA